MRVWNRGSSFHTYLNIIILSDTYYILYYVITNKARHCTPWQSLFVQIICCTIRVIPKLFSYLTYIYTNFYIIYNVYLNICIDVIKNK